VLGILVVVLGMIYAVETSWLTAGERKVAVATLAEIDAMQRLVQDGGNDNESRDQQAKLLVEDAHHRSRTIRDGRVASSLEFYLFQTEDARRESEFLNSIQQRTSQASAALQGSEKKWDGSSSRMRTEARSLVTSSLQ
jgi:hypothetical protein